MGRRRSSLGFVLPLLLLAAGLAISLAHAPQFPDASARFSAPCEPATPTVQCDETAKAASKIDSALPAAALTASAVAAPVWRDKVTLPARLCVLALFPPLFRRPPPCSGF